MHWCQIEVVLRLKFYFMLSVKLAEPSQELLVVLCLVFCRRSLEQISILAAVGAGPAL